MGQLIIKIQEIQYDENGKILILKDDQYLKKRRKNEIRKYFDKQLIQRVPATLKDFIEEMKIIE